MSDEYFKAWRESQGQPIDAVQDAAAVDGEKDTHEFVAHEFVADPYRPRQCLNCARHRGARVHDAALASQNAVEGEAVAGLCPRCAGSGREPNARDLQCSKCLGSGAVVTPPRPAVEGEAVATLAEQIVMTVKKLIRAEDEHARKHEVGENTSRDEADEWLIALNGFTVADCDAALKLIRRRSPRPAAVDAGAREALTPGADEAFTALDLADRLIERGYGNETPKEWHKAYRAVAKARSLAAKREPQE